MGAIEGCQAGVNEASGEWMASAVWMVNTVWMASAVWMVNALWTVGGMWMASVMQRRWRRRRAMVRRPPGRWPVCHGLGDGMMERAPGFAVHLTLLSV